MLKGIPAAPGIVVGKAFVFGKEDLDVAPIDITEDQVPLEISRFEDALIQTRQEIIALQKKIAADMGSEHGEVFDAHLLVLEDRMLIEEVISRVKKEKLNIDYIFSQVLKRYAHVFSKIEDEYLKERISDINDVGRRILRNLLGRMRKGLAELEDEVVVVAHDLSPSDTASMHKNRVKGFITDIGGKTSHTAIMAKSLEIPAVVGLEIATEQIKNGDIVIVDGASGTVIVSPDADTLKKYQVQEEKLKGQTETLAAIRNLPAQTTDGRHVTLAANIEFPDEIPSVLEHGADGVGLYRTEYFYMNRKDLPVEDEQFEAYKNLATTFGDKPVIVRTLDLGGDKFISQFNLPKEMSPFMGWRAIRFCLGRPDIFKTQLRAILRASVFGNLKIMFPMISGVEELRRAKEMVEEAKKELKGRGIAYNAGIEIGAMIEVPSAALTSDVLAREVGFFSIGTNDLIQYALAVDRTNEKIAYLYEPTHPAVLRLVKNVVEAGHRANIWVGMCGEMSSEPSLAILLLGLGLDEFSMPSASLLEIKNVIRAISYETAKKIAEEALGLATGQEVNTFLTSRLKDLLPQMYGN
ncbi:phosphoenolpyruvate-protein kinase (PTS system EI component in bacteria) [Candidatus Velamenicoccus archaeovorus]|uniref:Phosphoenolpyruvate-protein phosphotransferase n=1 Tax=Velamenicoccus archaeovorus TaxID=1930593 RepID=A0A410P6Z2_VELA1|nr:phosphoenolpyruvate-protein kinase (PTS system EI component in bacteria) [Candidatus Velamenicoccus archaeovorus]